MNVRFHVDVLGQVDGFTSIPVLGICYDLRNPCAELLSCTSFQQLVNSVSETKKSLRKRLPLSSLASI